MNIIRDILSRVFYLKNKAHGKGLPTCLNCGHDLRPLGKFILPPEAFHLQDKTEIYRYFNRWECKGCGRVVRAVGEAGKAL